jgi:hypothetical protein
MGNPCRIAVYCLAVMALAACSSEPDDGQTEKDHVLKEKTEAIDKAREVETILKRKQQEQESQ